MTMGARHMRMVGKLKPILVINAIPLDIGMVRATRTIAGHCVMICILIQKTEVFAKVDAISTKVY